jgi:protein SCO1/2
MMNKRLHTALMLVSASLMLSACGTPAPAERPPLEGARIGGGFDLINQDGARVRDTDFAGKYRIMYFGYSFCPDVCPVDLQRLMRGLSLFEKADPARGGAIAPLFISVDPARDTPAALKPFVARYHPRLQGLTGSDAAIAAVAKSWLVDYRRIDGSAPDRYLIAHRQFAYLVGPKGEPLALLPLDDVSTPDNDEGTPANVAADLDRWVK